MANGWAVSCGAQAVVKKEAGDWDGAFVAYGEVLALREGVCGAESERVGDLVYCMANARVLQGSRSGASASEPSQAAVSSALSVLALDLTLDLCLSPDAAMLYTKAAAIFSAALGPSNRKALDSQRKAEATGGAE